MRRSFVIVGLLMVALAANAGSSLAQSQRPLNKGFGEVTDIGRADAVARVLAVDPRYAGLIDHDRLRREVAASFEGERYHTDSFYRVLGPSWAELDGWYVSLREPIGWLVEVNLVSGCAEVELAEADLPIEDPCAWRRTWVYRVEPDGVVTPVLAVGDPDPGT